MIKYTLEQFNKDVLILNINNVESLESTIDYLKKEEI